MSKWLCGFQLPAGLNHNKGEGLFIRKCSDRTRGSIFKVENGRFRLDIRKIFFHGGEKKVVKH